jgi:hypothetical protein
MPPQKKSKKNVPAQIEKTTILLKGMKSLSSLNLPTPQIKNGEQSLKL